MLQDCKKPLGVFFFIFFYSLGMVQYLIAEAFGSLMGNVDSIRMILRSISQKLNIASISDTPVSEPSGIVGAPSLNHSNRRQA